MINKMVISNLWLQLGRLASSGITKLTSSVDDDSFPLLHKRKFMITDILNKNGGGSRPGSPNTNSETGNGNEIRDSLFSRWASSPWALYYKTPLLWTLLFSTKWVWSQNYSQTKQ